MRLEDPITIGGVEVRNRLYRAPLLERAGDGPAPAERYVSEFEPNAEAGVGLVMQGATPVSPPGEGCAAPEMTHVNTRAKAQRLGPVPEAVHAHGATIFAQLAHGGLRSQEVWNREYRRQFPDATQRAVSGLPWPLWLADKLRLLRFDVEVLSTDGVYELADRFGRAASWLIDAGYDGIHLAGGTMGLFQQFLSPFYNGREDEFGGDLTGRIRFFEAVHDAVRDHAGDVPLVVKVPAEADAPWFIRPRLTIAESVDVSRRLAGLGFDALVPVVESTFWDQSIVKGAYPARSWTDDRFQTGYESVLGGRIRTWAVRMAHRLLARRYSFEAGWNESYCRRVRQAVDVPVLQVGGIRTRSQIDDLLGDACDMVGIGRPFYAEPRLPARLLSTSAAAVVCESCNNCVVPQIANGDGVCRTPSVLKRRGALERAGAYDGQGGDTSRQR